MFRRAAWRLVSTEAVESKLRASAALAPTAVAVTDISGGCGSFYKVEVESPAFDGKSMIQQHRMVHQCLKAEIAEMHGITVVSKAPAAKAE